jgi:serine/threonine protein phosphatase PrpC
MIIHVDTQEQKSFACFASLTPKLEEELNEDAATVFCGVGSTLPTVAVAAVADGLGSYSHAREAAKFVIDRIAVLSNELRLDSAENLTDLFTRLRQDLRDHVRNSLGAPLLEEHSYGTTLLIAVETPTQLLAAYAGNGGIWHLRGNFDDSTGPTRIPWCSVNYLRPHSVLVDGKERLYNLIDLSEKLDDLPPTVITVNKDLRFGDIIVLCTDGIYSADQALHGIDPKGDLWIGAGAAMVSFYERLRSFFSCPCQDLDLKRTMQEYLQDLKDRRLLEDDATIGIIVTGAALAHQQKKRRSLLSG